MIPDTESPSERAIRAVATRLETDPLSLPPLYDSVDPEVLDACIDRTSGVSVSFHYAGVPVTVDRTGAVRIDGSVAPPAGGRATEDTEASD